MKTYKLALHELIRLKDKSDGENTVRELKIAEERLRDLTVSVEANNITEAFQKGALEFLTVLGAYLSKEDKIEKYLVKLNILEIKGTSKG